MRGYLLGDGKANDHFLFQDIPGHNCRVGLQERHSDIDGRGRTVCKQTKKEAEGEPADYLRRRNYGKSFMAPFLMRLWDSGSRWTRRVTVWPGRICLCSRATSKLRYRSENYQVRRRGRPDTGRKVWN